MGPLFNRPKQEIIATDRLGPRSPSFIEPPCPAPPGPRARKNFSRAFEMGRSMTISALERPIRPSRSLKRLIRPLKSLIKPALKGLARRRNS